MLKRIRLHYGYLFITAVLIAVEIIIARFTGGWVRSYLGDVLVVMVIYTAVLSILDLDKRLVLWGTLLFSFAIECAQYFKLATLLGFERGSLGYVLLGNTFSGLDLLCYSVGCLLILIQITYIKA